MAEVWGATWAEWECTSLRLPQPKYDNKKTHTCQGVGFFMRREEMIKLNSWRLFL